MTALVGQPESSGLWHAALFHRGTAEFEAETARFAEAAARAGAAVLITGPADRLTGLRARLDGLGERVSWADMADIGANPGRLISAISRFADLHPDRVTWCVQQAAWPARPAEELLEVFRHEALLNLALAGAPVRMLCPFDTRLPTEATWCAEATHPVIMARGHWQPSPRYRNTRGRVPAECDRPLSAVPANALIMSYDDNLTTMRRLVSLRAAAAGLPPDRAADLLIAVGELAANTLVHADGHGTVSLWTTGAEIICQVSDRGYIADPLAGRLRPDPGDEHGGRGLWLVHQLCDLVQTRTGPLGTTIRVHMRLPRIAA